MRIGHEIHNSASKSLELNSTTLTLNGPLKLHHETKHSLDLDKLLNNTLAGCKPPTNFGPCHVHLWVVVKNQVIFLLDPDRVVVTRKIHIIGSTPTTLAQNKF